MYTGAVLLGFAFFAWAWWVLHSHIRLTRRVKTLTRELDALHIQLQNRSDLSNEIAHDIKNPITAILCSAEALELVLGPKLETPYRESLVYIREYGEHLLRLVSDFMDLNITETGQMSIKPDRIDLFRIAQTSVGLLHSTAIKRKIHVQVLGDGDPTWACADPKHVKQILFNLIHNALKFTPDQGEVKIEFESNYENDRVKALVSDTGIGIPKERLSSVFDLYSRYDGNEPAYDAGTGVGLALCKSLVTRNGGEISVRSELHVGTTFIVEFPMHPDAKREWSQSDLTKVKVHHEENPLRGKTILVVDDDPGARESVSALLRALGGVVEQASFAVDALEKLTKHYYDAVMIDHETDGGCGYALARIIREDLKQPETKIILSGRETPDASLAREFGADRCVEKPFNRRILVESLLESSTRRGMH